VSARGDRLRAIAHRVEELIDRHEAAYLRAFAVLVETEPPQLVVLSDCASALEAAADRVRGLPDCAELIRLWREAANLIREGRSS
jgi:hypothetical protein